MKPFIYNDWHIWKTETGAILVSNESKKQLHEFDNTDDAVNWLLLSPDGDRPTARYLNAHIKANKP